MGNKTSVLNEHELASLSKISGLGIDDLNLMQANFWKLDKDEKGYVTKKDLLDRLGTSNSDEKAFAGRLLDLFSDRLADQRLSFPELILALSEFRANTNDAKLRLLFTLVDSDGNGRIGAKELEEAFKLVRLEHLTKQDLAEIAQQTLIYADTGHNGFITFDEFKEFFNTVLQITI